MRRALGFGLTAAGVAVSAPALAQQPFLKEADAAHEMFPEGTRTNKNALELSDAEREQLSKTLGKKVDVRHYDYLEVKQGDDVVGWIFELDVLGQTYPITFAVGVSRAQALRDVQVMQYREPRGAEIQERRFRLQFLGKKKGAELQVGRDLEAISGATISSRSAAWAGKKALALAKLLLARPADAAK